MPSITEILVSRVGQLTLRVSLINGRLTAETVELLSAEDLFSKPDQEYGLAFDAVSQPRLFLFTASKGFELRPVDIVLQEEAWKDTRPRLKTSCCTLNRHAESARPRFAANFVDVRSDRTPRVLRVLPQRSA